MTKRRKESLGHVDRSSWRSLHISGVYAIALAGCGAVKIGWSKNISHRIADLSVAMPFEPILLGVRPTDDQKKESVAHKALREFRIRGECFLWCDPVKNYIATNFTTDERDDGDGIVDNLPFAPIAPEDDYFAAADLLEAVDRAFNSLNAKGRDVLCRSIETGKAPATIEDICAMLSGPGENVPEFAWKKALARLARRMRRHGETHGARMIESISGRLLKYKRGGEKLLSPSAST